MGGEEGTRSSGTTRRKMLQLPSVPSIMITESIAWFTIFYFGNGRIPTDIMAFVLSTSQAQVASPNWWNHRHFQHHAKINIFQNDQDVNMLHVFSLGKWLSIEYNEKLKCLPYNHQQEYFFLIGPPLLIPMYFQYQIIMTMIIAKTGGLGLGHHLRSFCGILGAIFFLNFIRFLESHWFVWVTQMNHIVIEIDWAPATLGGIQSYRIWKPSPLTNI
uniref:Fatty acid desaturase domain-containing protein n=1 Tax=Myotis myotis TaxID=51298 RepID=A0A7J7V2P8_MYOMY|nr:hypothetical protein mMyoMyo1_004754 [Myotis myotis]